MQDAKDKSDKEKLSVHSKRNSEKETEQNLAETNEKAKALIMPKAA